MFLLFKIIIIYCCCCYYVYLLFKIFLKKFFLVVHVLWLGGGLRVCNKVYLLVYLWVCILKGQSSYCNNHLVWFFPQCHSQQHCKSSTGSCNTLGARNTSLFCGLVHYILVTCLILMKYTEYCKNFHRDLGFCVRVLSFVVVFKDSWLQDTVSEPRVKFKSINDCSFLSTSDP